MTVEPIKPDEPLHFDVEPQVRALIPITLGDDPRILHVREPKSATMLRIGRDAFAGGEGAGVRVTDETLRVIFPDPDDYEYLTGRLDDEDDDLDLDHLAPLLDLLLVRAGGGRPTKRSSGSGRPQPRSGKRSTARRRSTA